MRYLTSSILLILIMGSFVLVNASTLKGAILLIVGICAMMIGIGLIIRMLKP